MAHIQHSFDHWYFPKDALYRSSSCDVFSNILLTMLRYVSLFPPVSICLEGPDCHTFGDIFAGIDSLEAGLARPCRVMLPRNSMEGLLAVDGQSLTSKLKRTLVPKKEIDWPFDASHCIVDEQAVVVASTQACRIEWDCLQLHMHSHQFNSIPPPLTCHFLSMDQSILHSQPLTPHTETY